jgi:predicted PolB exonuclease-like 3'-5' exonuclease
MNTLFFALQTIPDTEVGRVRYQLGDLHDKGSAKAMFHHQQQQTGSCDLPHYLQKIIVLSAIYVDEQGKAVHYSWASDELTEKEILQQFSQLVEEYRPRLVLWNGAFNIPVMRYRYLKNHIVSTYFFAESEAQRVVNLQDVLSAYSVDANTTIQNVSALLGLKASVSLEYQAVWKTWLEGDIATLRLLCEQRVLNIYEIYQCYLLVKG